MPPQGLKRKLAAILSADVAGYSRLMQDNEEATIHTLTDYRRAMADLIQQYRGRVVDSPGDNLLAEFASVVDAVNCAVETQRELAVRNADSPENRRMLFRIGVNLGDVVTEGDRIYGDGVNIAARMEGLAEGGGICLSGTVYDKFLLRFYNNSAMSPDRKSAEILVVFKRQIENVFYFSLISMIINKKIFKFQAVIVARKVENRLFP